MAGPHRRLRGRQVCKGGGQEGGGGREKGQGQEEGLEGRVQRAAGRDEGVAGGDELGPRLLDLEQMWYGFIARGTKKNELLHTGPWAFCWVAQPFSPCRVL